MRHKKFDQVEIKADGDEAGSFTALASVFGNVDLAGDRMLPGAFTKTLQGFRDRGDPIPVVLSHQWDDPNAYIGKADPNHVEETDAGLVVRGKLNIAGNPTARQVYDLMKDRVLKGWSFGYTVPDGGEKVGKDGANEVSEVDLVEVGPTLKGANPEAQLQAIKSAATLTPPAVEIEDGEHEEPDSAKSRPQDPLAAAVIRERLRSERERWYPPETTEET